MILKSAALSVMWLRSCTEYPFQLIHYARLAKAVFIIDLNNLIIYYDRIALTQLRNQESIRQVRKILIMNIFIFRNNFCFIIRSRISNVNAEFIIICVCTCFTVTVKTF